MALPDVTSARRTPSSSEVVGSSSRSLKIR